jgi:hypothetical protein
MGETLFAEVPHDTGADQSYRPVSGLAVAGFIVGCLSVAALVSKVMWFVPALGIAINIAGLRQAAVTSRKGAGLSRAGLALSALFLAAGVSSSWYRDTLVRTQAQRVAERWLEAARAGNFRLAHQLSLSPDKRQASSEGLEAVYTGDATLAEGLQDYLKLEVMLRLSKLGQSPEPVTISASPVSWSNTEYQENVEFACDARYEQDGAAKSYPFTLYTTRDQQFAPHIAGWRVTSAIAAEPQATATSAADGPPP